MKRKVESELPFTKHLEMLNYIEGAVPDPVEPVMILALIYRRIFKRIYASLPYRWSNIPPVLNSIRSDLLNPAKDIFLLLLVTQSDQDTLSGVHRSLSGSRMRFRQRVRLLMECLLPDTMDSNCRETTWRRTGPPLLATALVISKALKAQSSNPHEAVKACWTRHCVEKDSREPEFDGG